MAEQMFTSMFDAKMATLIETASDRVAAAGPALSLLEWFSTYADLAAAMRNRRNVSVEPLEQAIRSLEESTAELESIARTSNYAARSAGREG